MLKTSLVDLFSPGVRFLQTNSVFSNVLLKDAFGSVLSKNQTVYMVKKDRKKQNKAQIWLASSLLL